MFRRVLAKRFYSLRGIERQFELTFSLSHLNSKSKGTLAVHASTRMPANPDWLLADDT